MSFDEMRNTIQQALVAMRLPDISVDAAKARIIWNQFPIDCKAHEEIIAKHRAKDVDVDKRIGLLNQILKCFIYDDLLQSEKDLVPYRFAANAIIDESKIEPVEEPPVQISRPEEPSEEQRIVRRRIEATPVSAASSSSSVIPSGLRASFDDAAEAAMPAPEALPKRLNALFRAPPSLRLPAAEDTVTMDPSIDAETPIVRCPFWFSRDGCHG